MVRDCKGANMAKGISVNFGSLNITTPPVIVPTDNSIGNLSNAVIAQMNNSEEYNQTSNAAPVYNAISELMQNNANYTTGQNAVNQAFNNTAANTAEYQANAIGNQGKK